MENNTSIDKILGNEQFIKNLKIDHGMLNKYQSNNNYSNKSYVIENKPEDTLYLRVTYNGADELRIATPKKDNKEIKFINNYRPCA